ncbi:hypothetical protein [Streptomyces apocyni]|uniref:hypothetical protein n=1 Tax=Streptomyces apocyni TaxID=2654677 RepID=UPI0012EAA59A|nr:hypothetical protein [Streptomyces apocyni]
MHPPPLHTEQPTKPSAPAAARLRAAWRSAHEPVAGVSRRTQLIAYAVPLAVLPSSIWRLPIVFDGEAGIGIGEKVYVVLLSVLSEVLAFTAVGLIARWGEVFPRWVPILRGRHIPTRAVVIPSAIGAALLTFLWTVLTSITQVMGTTITGDQLPDNFPTETGGWQATWFHICYTPLLLWGPLLAALTITYAKRRRGEAA